MEIKDFKKIDNGGALKAAFQVFIPEWGEMQIQSLYFETDKGQTWVSFASKEYIDKEGKKKSFPQVRFNQKTNDALEKAIKEKIKPMLGNLTNDPMSDYDNELLPF